MAKMYPFRAVIYNEDKVSDISSVVTQPYDKIDNIMQATYYDSSYYNAVRIVKGNTYADDNSENNQYTRARTHLNEWLEENVLKRLDTPAIYPYYQEYKAMGTTYIRRGFVSLTEAVPPGEGVKAHEKTLAAPKIDRLNLMRTTFANFGHIFMLYDDPSLQIEKKMQEFTDKNDPIIEATDDFGEKHKAWQITDPAFIKMVQEVMADKELYIADGHHRFETAGNFRKEKEEQYLCDNSKFTENPTNVMCTCINMNDPGLIVLPTHRLVHNVKDFNPENFEKQLSENFELQTFSYTEENETHVANKMFDELKKAKNSKHAFGVYIKGYPKMLVATLKNEEIMFKAMGTSRSKEWCKLDVSILHTLIMEHLLGIDEKALEAETNVEYEREYFDCIKRVNKEDKLQMSLFVNPTKVSDIKDVAKNSERMPQKSTDFYPKLLTGFLNNVMVLEEKK